MQKSLFLNVNLYVGLLFSKLTAALVLIVYFQRNNGICLLYNSTL